MTGDECTIVTWEGWNVREVSERLRNEYWNRHKRELVGSWITYIGGLQFRDKMEGAYAPDIIIGDFEFMSAYARQGRLVPFAACPEESALGDLRYPDWLLEWALCDGPQVFAMPVRWGTAAVLADRSLLRHKADSLVTMSQLLDATKRVLLYNPGEYALPSLAFLARAVCPASPFWLTDDEFEQLRRLLNDLLEAGALVADSFDEFATCMRSGAAPLVLCAGDWVLRVLGNTSDEGIAGIERDYDLVFPEEAPFAYFEMIGIPVTAPHLTTARRVRDIIVSPAFRQAVERLEVRSGGYWSSPTTGDPELIGPGYKGVVASDVLARASPRFLPRNEAMHPRLAEWQEMWRQFVRAARGRSGRLTQ